VVNLAAKEKEKMASSCKRILSSMFGLTIQVLELCRDCEVVSILSYWTAVPAP
jgi:hypothetical protein